MSSNSDIILKIQKVLKVIGVGILSIILLLTALGAIVGRIEDHQKKAALIEFQNKAKSEVESKFKSDPDAFIARIDKLLKNKQAQAARYEIKMLEAIPDQRLVDLKRKIEMAIQNEDSAQAAEIAKAQKRAAQEANLANSSALKGLDKCKAEIAKYFNADGAGQIPDVQNFGSGNEFVYGWPKGQFSLTTIFGTVPMSASCDGTLKPNKVMSLSINGKTIILGGRRY